MPSLLVTLAVAMCWGHSPSFWFPGGPPAAQGAPAATPEGGDLAPEGGLYGVVVDAGSSGSRVRVYQWPPRPNPFALPQVSEIFSMKTEPGISSFATDLQGLTGHVTWLLGQAAGKVPSDQHPGTSVYLMATAGMRLIMEDKANSVIEEIQTILGNNTLNPFQFEDNQARILSGEEEGVFAWIAANYLNKYFDDPETKDSVGILELGGASTQIAFIPSGSILENKFPVRLGGRSYPLYVNSYLYYGQNYAELWVKEHLHRLNPGLATLQNPCMLTGDTESLTIQGTQIQYVGLGDPWSCLDLVHLLVHKSPPTLCQPKPCAIGTVYQPTVAETHEFWALSAFYFPLRTLKVLAEDGTFTPVDTLTSAFNYCKKPLDVVRNETGSDNFLSTECLMGLYAPTLFTKGYGFENDTRQIRALTKINQQPIEWPLGAILYETERRPKYCHTLRTEKSTEAAVCSAAHWTTSVVTSSTSALVYTLAFSVALSSQLFQGHSIRS